MHLATRHKHGPALVRRLKDELGYLAAQHPAGFVVRLHVLGDFYSKAYVEFWRRQLVKYPQLRIFGYTARMPDSAIGSMIKLLRSTFADRVSIRFSSIETITAVDFNEAVEVPDAVVCPAQTGRVENCGACTVCWASKKLVTFIEH
jgi:hypothetical protein